MVIENDKQTVRFKAQRILYAIFIGILVILLSYFFPEDGPVYGVSKWIIIGIPLAAYILFLFYYYSINATYLYFSNDKGVFVFRFFSVRGLGESRKSIEIPSDQLVGMVVAKTFFSKRVEMTLYKKLGKGNAKYPSISLSLMPRVQRDQLLHILNSAVEKNLTM